jgi:hypothetical protein
VAEVVELSGRDAGAHVRGNEIEDFRSELARDPHALDLFGPLHNYGH